MTCPLCGYRDIDYKVLCTHCALHSKCKLLCCPNCGYQFPQDSRLIIWMKSFLTRRKRSAAAED